MTPPDQSAGIGPDARSGLVLADRYRLDRTIASGGMATVWEASDQLLGRRVAVKILHPHLARDDSFVRRFRGEAVAAARLTHPSIVSVYDTVSSNGVDAIVMELVSGTTLRADLDEHGPLRLHAALAIGTQVADALGAAHAAGLVHRDVKPANILLSSDGRVLVADFGIAKAAQGSDLTEAGAMVGTAKYLAPEQVEGGPIDGRTDLYALGVVLYEALTGQPPFLADTDAGTAFARLHRDPQPPRSLRPDIPAGVEQVVLKAMARRPEDRFADAASLRWALLGSGADPTRAPAAAQAAAAAAQPGPPGTTSRTPGPSPTPRPPAAPPAHAAPADPTDASAGHEVRPTRRRSRGPLWLLLALALIGAVAAVVFGAGLLGDEEPPRGDPLPIAQVGSFDPEGDRTEQHALLPRLVDDDPSTWWRTETYSAPDFPTANGKKSGAGFYALLDTSHRVRTIELQTPVGGWSARVYVVDELGEDGAVPPELSGWGDPVAEITDAPTGRVDVPVEAATGQAVLIWFTKATTFDDVSFAVQISDVSVRGS